MGGISQISRPAAKLCGQNCSGIFQQNRPEAGIDQIRPSLNRKRPSEEKTVLTLNSLAIKSGKPYRAYIV